MKYACIARYRSDAPVRLLCRVLGVSPSGFYAAEQHRDHWYNHQRRHSALGYLSPIAYERQLARLRIA